MANQDEILTLPSHLLRNTDDPVPCVASSAFALMTPTATAHGTPGRPSGGPAPQPGTCAGGKALLRRLATAAVRRMQAAANWLHCAAADLAERYELDDEIQLDDLDHMQSWSLSSRLAATSPSTLPLLPEHLAGLIAQAKELHPRMAEGALRRDQAAAQP